MPIIPRKDKIQQVSSILVMVSLANTNLDPKLRSRVGRVSCIKGWEESQCKLSWWAGRRSEVSAEVEDTGWKREEEADSGDENPHTPNNHIATHSPTPILCLIESSFRTGGTSLKPKTSSARYKKDGGGGKKSHLFRTPSATEPKALYLFYRNHRAVERVSPEKMGLLHISSPFFQSNLW